MEEYNINRADYIIIQQLYKNNCTSYFNSMTITELFDTDKMKCTRMTIYRKLQKLVKQGYLVKGIKDDHADTYYLTENAIRICKLEESR